MLTPNLVHALDQEHLSKLQQSLYGEGMGSGSCLPKLTKKQKLKREVEKLKGALDYTNEELQNEIERGNDLCKIIYKLVHGHGPEGEPLEMHEIACIARITNNNKRH